MRYLIFITVLITFSVKSFGQDNSSTELKIMGDSILKVYELEKDLDQRLDKLLRFTNFSGLEADPLYCLEFASKIYKISQKNYDRYAEATA